MWLGWIRFDPFSCFRVPLFFLLFLMAVHLSLRTDVFGVTEPLPSSVVLDRFADIPVDMASGDVELYERPDIVVQSRGFHLDVVRNYQAQRHRDGPFGYGWQWKHGDRLIFKPMGVVEIHTDNKQCAHRLEGVRRGAPLRHNLPTGPALE